MLKAQKQELKNYILVKIEEMKTTIRNYEVSTKPIPPDNAIGRLTRMEAINSKSINEEALRKAQTTLSKLERALSKVDNPEFGVCEECEEPIPFARLKVMPEAILCVQCMQAFSG